MSLPLAWSPCLRNYCLHLLHFPRFFLHFWRFLQLTMEFCYGQTGDPGILWTALNEADMCWLPALSMAGKPLFHLKIDPTYPKRPTWKTETQISPEFPKIKKLFQFFYYSNCASAQPKLAMVALDVGKKSTNDWVSDGWTFWELDFTLFRCDLTRPIPINCELQTISDWPTNQPTNQWTKRLIELRPSN